jgi:hypothetical protein
MSQSQTPARYNNSFFFAAQLVQHYVCRVPAGFDLKEVLKPGYWAHVSNYLKPGYVIEIWPDDFAYVARLRVIASGHLFANVALESEHKLELTGDDRGSLEIEWSGPSSKYRVRRGRDVLESGFADKKAAQRWIDEEYGKKAA